MNSIAAQFAGVFSDFSADAEPAPAEDGEKTPKFITIGNFDGLHLGHKSLINTLCADAHSQGARAYLITFEPHPREVLFHPKPFSRIYSKEDKLRLLRQHSALSGVYTFPFSKDLAALTAESFLQDLLFPLWNITKIVVGHDFAFGKDRQASYEELSAVSARYGIAVERFPQYVLPAGRRHGGTVVSSTSIRENLRSANFVQAAELLGRAWSVGGLVVHGHQRGRTLGFPTLNMPSIFSPPLQQGVYLTHTAIEGQLYKSITNFGCRPTIDGGSGDIFETHLFGGDGDFYGKHAEVFFHRFIREERRFASVQELQAQIASDVKLCRNIFLEGIDPDTSLGKNTATVHVEGEFDL